MPPRTKISRQDLLEFENVELKVRELQRQADELDKQRRKLLAKYDIVYEEIGKTVGWNANGVIHRKKLASIPPSDPQSA